MTKEGYRPLDNDVLEHLEMLGYAYLYFDESEQVDDWIDDAKGEDAQALEDMFGSVEPGFLVAVPMVLRNEDLDGYGWLSAVIDSAATQEMIQRGGKKIIVEKRLLDQNEPIL